MSRAHPRGERRWAAVLGLMFWIAATPLSSDLFAQVVTHQIPEEVGFSGCTIEPDRLATLHDRHFPRGALIDGGDVHVTSDGRFLVIAGPEWRELFVAGADGTISAQIGRVGEGPGEFERPFAVMETPSAFLVLDSRLRRVTELNRSDFSLVRTDPLPPGDLVSPPLAAEDGRYLMRADVRTPDHAGYALHLVSADGTIIRSFDADDGGIFPSQDAQPLFLAAGGDSVVWVAYDRRYRIEKWDWSGRLLEVYERASEWFPADQPFTPEPGSWFARMSGIHQDENGQLWVHIVRRIAPTPPQEPGDRAAPEPGVRPDSTHFESVVEVLDPVRGHMIASTRLTAWRAVSATGGFYHVITDTTPAGEVLLHVWGFRLLC